MRTLTVVAILVGLSGPVYAQSAMSGFDAYEAQRLSTQNSLQIQEMRDRAVYQDAQRSLRRQSRGRVWMT